MQASDLFIWGILLGVLLAIIAVKKIKRRKMRKMLQKAKSAEKRAALLLEKWGYHVLAVQLRETVTISVDNKPHECPIRADLLVRKGFKRYIVEVKTGNQTQATLPNVRRQLLEYYLVYRPDGMLLLDMEKEKLKEIKFTGLIYHAYSVKQLVIAMIAGICLGYGILKILG